MSSKFSLSQFFSNKTAKSDAPNAAQNSEQNDELKAEEKIELALKEYRSDNFPDGILALCHHLEFITADKSIQVCLSLPFPCTGELQTLAQRLSDSLAMDVTLVINLVIKPVRQHGIKNVANIIAIASGKGGVGKSTTTVNLAYALIAEGAKVGILDADIYGPSIPAMLGIKNQTPTSEDGKTMIPLNANGLCAMSIGFLVPDEQATVWRGPMASTAFSQLLNETAWPELDYLLIDMPPGTGDIQLTLAQKVPVAAAVVITTPQDIALADAVKGIVMFDKVQVPVLGIVENMSYHICENCGFESHLFGESGGGDIAEIYSCQLLGQLPLDIAIREDADLGKSGIINNNASDISLRYRGIAQKMAAQLFLQLDPRSGQTAEIIER